jgi:hypothetical protein
VLLAGVLLAIVGVVQAAWMAEVPESEPSVAQEALVKQIEQLKTELDQERAEKSELLAKIEGAEAPAEAAAADPAEETAPPAPSVAAEPAVVEASSPAPAPAVPEASDVPAAVPPPAEPPPASLQRASAEPPAPATKTASTTEASDLPQAMAPSAELLLNEVPVEAGPPPADSSSYGIHLASFADRTMAERGWALLQRNHPAALGELKPRVDEAKDEKGKPVFLLIAGPFESEELAAAHCRKITTQVVFCKPRPFSGNELAASTAP